MCTQRQKCEKDDFPLDWGIYLIGVIKNDNLEVHFGVTTIEVHLLLLDIKTW